MANVQPENGFTKIANELLEAFAKKELSGRAFRCVLAIIRETYGWNRKEVVLSSYRLSGITGIAPQHVFTVTKELEKLGIITREPNPKGTVVSLNKNYDRWVESIPELGITENGNTENGITNPGITGITENGNTGITENGNTPCMTSLDSMPCSESLKKDKERIKKEIGKASAKLTDDQFFSSLKSNPAYKGIDIDREIGKMQAYLLTKPGRSMTRRFVINWLNRIDQPVSVEPEDDYQLSESQVADAIEYEEKLAAEMGMDAYKEKYMRGKK